MTTWAGTAVIYESLVRHTRLRPTRYSLRHRTYYWLVDVDDLPRPPWWLRPFAGFHAADHLGDPNASIGDNINTYLREAGVEPPGGSIHMLAQARVFGYVFNPLTVYWCHDRDDRLRYIVAEVHNTYGGRHRYLLHPAEDGTAEVAKAFYVSPFYGTDGNYRMRLPEPRRWLRLAIVYEPDETPGFVASLTGLRRSAGTGALLSAAIRYPLATLWASAAIRWHGIRLYLKGLPIHDRTKAPVTKGSR